MEQRTFAEEARGAYLVDNLDIKQIIRNGIKDFFPLIVYVSELKLSKVDLTFERAFLHGNKGGVEIDKNYWGGGGTERTYIELLNESLRYLRDSYSGEIIILNIPSILLQSDGKLIISKDPYEDVFIAACEQNDISYVQMGEIYIEEYHNRNILPYGFSNTEPGKGHLNKNGHQMVADALYTLLLESGVVK